MKRIASSETAVKRQRPYDATGRRQRAAETRARIVETAARRFRRDGYATTTIAAIAAEAGASVDTIYKSFGGKPGLVRAVYDQALEGLSDIPAEQRSDALQASEHNPRRLIESWGKFVAEIAPLAAPVATLIATAAATDPELRSLIADIDTQRHKRMTANARRLREAGHLRADITIGAAADILWTYSSPELYDLLVIRRGMPLDTYARFVADAMIAALLLPGLTDQRPQSTHRR